MTYLRGRFQFEAIVRRTFVCSEADMTRIRVYEGLRNRMRCAILRWDGITKRAAIHHTVAGDDVEYELKIAEEFRPLRQELHSVWMVWADAKEEDIGPHGEVERVRRVVASHDDYFLLALTHYYLRDHVIIERVP